MVTKKVKVNNNTGLHARPASILVQTASKYKSEVTIIFNEARINAKSIISVLSNAVSGNSDVILSINGEDELVALEGMVNLLENELGD